MRAVIVTRVMCLKYEGEEDPYDTLEEFLHETVEANKNARRGGDDDDDDDHDHGGGTNSCSALAPCGAGGGDHCTAAGSPRT